MPPLHSLLQYNPFYDLFYSATNMATTVAIILGVATLVALVRRNVPASIGFGVSTALVTAAAIVMHLSDLKIDSTFAHNEANWDHMTPVLGVQFLGTPIIMGVATLALLVLTGAAAWTKRYDGVAKLTAIIATLLGASLFGTFATQLMSDTYVVGNSYWSAWSNFGSWLWAADFVLACTLGLLALIAGGTYVRNNVTFETLKVTSSGWRRVQITGNKPLTRTAEAPATA